MSENTEKARKSDNRKPCNADNHGRRGPKRTGPSGPPRRPRNKPPAAQPAARDGERNRDSGSPKVKRFILPRKHKKRVECHPEEQDSKTNRKPSHKRQLHTVVVVVPVSFPFSVYFAVFVWHWFRAGACLTLIATSTYNRVGCSRWDPTCQSSPTLVATAASRMPYCLGGCCMPFGSALLRS